MKVTVKETNAILKPQRSEIVHRINPVNHAFPTVPSICSNLQQFIAYQRQRGRNSQQIDQVVD